MPMSQTIEIPLPDDILLLLDRKANTHGLGREAYVHSVLERDLRGTSELDAILAPIRAEVGQSGMSDEELDQLFREARQEVWESRNSPRP